MTDDSDTQLEALLRATAGTLVERLEIGVSEASAARTVGRMPVAGNTQPHGILHGGATAAFAETLASICAFYHAGRERVAVGIELSATHHRAVRTGHVEGVATAVHLGRSVATYEIVVTDPAGARVCTARLTCLIRDAARSG